MRFASIRRSPRLQRVHDLLQDGLIYSTRQVMIFANVCAVNSCISELRANGAEIECLTAKGREGGKVWTYRMTKPVPGYVSTAQPARMPF